MNRNHPKAETPSSPTITTTTIITTCGGIIIITTITTVVDGRMKSRGSNTGPPAQDPLLGSCFIWATLFLARLVFRGAVNVPVGAVEHGIRRGRPFGTGGQVRPVVENTARLKLALGGLFGIHRLEFEIRFLGDHD